MAEDQHAEKEVEFDMDDAWKHYETLKRRLDRLRARFYQARSAYKNRTKHHGKLWYPRQTEIKDILRRSREDLADLQGCAHEYHVCVSSEKRRWLEDQERLEQLLNKSKAAKTLAKLQIVHADVPVTDIDKQRVLIRRNGRPLPFRDDMFAEISELNRIYQELLKAMEESMDEEIDLDRHHEEPRVFQRPEQYRKQEALFSQTIAKRAKAREQLTLVEQGIFAAVRFGEPHTLRAILAEGRTDVNQVTGMSQETPLHIAAVGGHIEVAQILISAGATVDANNIDDWTPLHYCCGIIAEEDTAGLDRTGMVQCLLERGANPNLGITHGRAEEMPDGSTPLHIAAYSGAAAVSRLLLQYGGEPDAVDKNGRTPIMIAASQNHSEITTILEEVGVNMLKRDYWCETAEEHVRHMWERLGKKAEDERDHQTEKFFEILGNPLSDEDVKNLQHTHCHIVPSEVEGEPPGRIYYRVPDERLAQLYDAQCNRVRYNRKNMRFEECLGSERTCLIVDWKLPFPLHTPKTPTAPMQSPLQIMQRFLREAMPEGIIDSYLFVRGMQYRQYFVNTAISVKNQFMLHLFLRHRLDQALPQHRLYDSFNLKFLSMPMVGMLQADGSAPFEYYGHFDEYGLNMNEPSPSLMKLLRLTGVRQDEIPVEACPRLSRQVSLYYREWRTLQKQRLKGAVKAVYSTQSIFKINKLAKAAAKFGTVSAQNVTEDQSEEKKGVREEEHTNR